MTMPTEGGTGLQTRHRRVAFWCAATVAGMVGLSYASVPLYQMFCQVTGYGGTTQKAKAPSQTVLENGMTIRFDANVSPDLGWKFTPLQRTVDVKIGENTLIFYRAENISDRTITGTATFNVTPEISGSYFNKIACFCFLEQRLEPGESIEMPVSFFVDPAIVDEASGAGNLTQITLSYTFYPVNEAKTAVSAQARPAATQPDSTAGATRNGS